MILNLMKSEQMFSLTLPNKIKGQYWLTDIDDKQKARKLVSVEAANGVWVVKGNKKVRIYDADGTEQDLVPLNESSYLNIVIEGSDNREILYTEPVDASHQTLTKIAVTGGAVFTIGRAADNNFIYDYKFVSSHHAKLMYDGEEWSVSDTESKNGTYVNGYRVDTKKLMPGDFIYIMGLKIVIGGNFLAVNNPDGKLKIKSDSMRVYSGQTRTEPSDEVEIPEKQYFLRSPRFRREIKHEVITIDPPPPLQKIDSVPLALMLGPSITMGMTSVSTGILALTNVISNGGQITQAMPTLIMSVGMLLGTILWPILTKRYEKNEKIKAEKKRQEKYLAYLGEMGDAVIKKAKEQTEILAENLSSQDECAERIAREQSNLWDRITGQSDFLRLRLGLGNLPMDAEIKYQEKKFTMDDDTLQNAMLSLAESPHELRGVPISISLPESTVLGIYGEKKATDNMLKAMLLQMISLHSYDELKIMLIADEEDSKQWDFVKYVPHFWNNEKTVRFFAAVPDEVKELSSYIESAILTRPDKENTEYSEFSPYYVIIITSSKLGKYCDSLKSLLGYGNNAGFSVILSDEKFDSFPKETKTIVCADGENSKIFDKSDTTGNQLSFKAEYANETVFDHLSSKIANIELDINSSKYALPSMITFLEMFNVGKVEHLNSLARWKENNPTKSLSTPVGVDTDGDMFELDLHEKFHGPHGLVAGMTGSGKSEFIITYILSLAVNYHPDEVSFILIDYKGGGLTGAFEDTERGIKLPHLAGTITNLDGSAIKRSLVSIQSELRRRQKIFNEARKISGEGTMDIYKYQQLYRDKAVTEPLPHLFIISDEFAELKMQQPEFMEQLISTARIGRSLGVHLILATQKPNGVVDDQIWSNSKFRVCLKVQDKSDSQDMIKCSDAAELSQTGRFYLQVGFNEFFALGQSAWCGAEYVPSDTVEKAIDDSIQIIDNLGRVVMNVKHQTRGASNEKRIKQVVAIVKYLSDLASEENISVRSLWLEPIPEKIYADELEKKYGVCDKGFALAPVIGEYDDPFDQRQNVLTVPFSSEGNCIVYGATGNGKTTLLTTLCYSLIKNHSAEELNLYILDFGSETLKVFEKAPQVGDVITSSDEEKTFNLFKMLKQEIEHRKSLFSDNGGDYMSYCSSGAPSVPNIVVIVNNFAGFAEQYEDLLEDFTVLTRDGVKYGIYFTVTATGLNAVRYKIQQNFKMLMTMRLNDDSDYTLVVGRTDGLVPAKYKGRGLVSLDKIYEFQTAYASDSADMREYLKSYCEALAKSTSFRAKRVPVLPDTVDPEFVSEMTGSLKNVPVGVIKSSLDIATVNISSKVAFPVCAADAEDFTDFIGALKKMLSKSAYTKLYDADGILPSSYEYDANKEVVEMFDEMVKRNNAYKDANLDESVLGDEEERVYMIVGVKKFFDQLSEDGKDKFRTMLDKAEPIYKLHFVLCDSLTKLNSFNYDAWFKRQIANGDGIWLGDGAADQYLLKISKVTSDLYDEIGTSYGYVICRGRHTLMKLLSNGKEEA